MSNILNDYERTIYSVSDESLLSLVGRLSLINPRLLLLANICGLKICGGITVPDHMPCGIELLNKIHGYLFNYRFPRDLFLKILLYIFESCCLTYFRYINIFYFTTCTFLICCNCFRILSKWALKGILNDNETSLFIQSKSDFEDKDLNCRNNWNSFIINEKVKVPVFLDKYKNDILHCGKTINFFKKFNDLVSSIC